MGTINISYFKGVHIQMTQNNLPTASSSYWQVSTNLPTFPALKEDKVTADVGIVGAGITGITAAYLLSKQGVKVCLLDASTILSGTTGNTTAKINAQHGLIYAELIKHFGEERAKMYYDANNKAHKWMKDTIDELNIDCAYTPEDSYIYTNSEKYIDNIDNEQRAYEKLSIIGGTLDTVPLPFSVKYALKMDHQAHFHPLHYLHALLLACQKNGVQIYEQTRAATIEYNKQPAIVTHDGKRIICKQVIQASHYPFYDGNGFYPVRMYPDRSYIIAVKTEKKVEHGMYINAETPTRSIRPVTINDVNMLLIAGENHKTGQSKKPMLAHYEALAQFATQNLGAITIPYRWSAQDYVTLDKVPYVGPVTENQKNVFVATGFKKWGMTNGTNAALLLTDLIMENENPYIDLFSPSRNITPDPSMRKMVTYNADVAKHLIKGKLENASCDISKLNENEACVATINGQRIGAYKDTDGTLHTVDTTCTHLGCEVQWNNGENSWDCPCHGSRFTYTGEVLNGPAVKQLKKVEINMHEND